MTKLETDKQFTFCTWILFVNEKILYMQKCMHVFQNVTECLSISHFKWLKWEIGPHNDPVNSISATGTQSIYIQTSIQCHCAGTWTVHL